MAITRFVTLAAYWIVIIWIGDEGRVHKEKVKSQNNKLKVKVKK